MLKENLINVDYDNREISEYKKYKTKIRWNKLIYILTCHKYSKKQEINRLEI